jgi:hypothetical protein
VLIAFLIKECNVIYQFSEPTESIDQVEQFPFISVETLNEILQRRESS